MAPQHDDTEAHNEEAEAFRTEEALRLVKAFRNVESAAVREALIVIAEHLGGSKESLQ